MIVVNWGSSNFPAHRINADYAAIAERSSVRGTKGRGRTISRCLCRGGGGLDAGWRAQGTYVLQLSLPNWNRFVLTR